MEEQRAAGGAEQQLCAGLAERQIAEFVDHDEIVAQQSLDDASALSRRLFLFELIDEIDEVEEAASRPRADDRRGDGDRQMGLRQLPDARLGHPLVRSNRLPGLGGGGRSPAKPVSPGDFPVHREKTGKFHKIWQLSRELTNKDTLSFIMLRANSL